jgi:hypothetical protein
MQLLNALKGSESAEGEYVKIVFIACLSKENDTFIYISLSNLNQWITYIESKLNFAEI